MADGPGGPDTKPKPRDPDVRAIRIRDVFPWWYLAGVGVSVVITIVVPPFREGGASLVGWGGLIGSTIRDRRIEEANRQRSGLPPTARWRGEEPLIAAVTVVLFSALQLMLSGIFGGFDPGPFWVGLGGVVVIGVAIGVLLLVGLDRRRRARAAGDLGRPED